MDIVQEIKKDHKELKELFQKATSAKTEKSKEKEFLELKKELVPHMKAEETVFYPVLMKGKSREDVLEGFEEHHASENVLKELEKTSFGDEKWPAKLKVLKDMVEHHIKEEESNILKTAQSDLDKEKLKELAEKFDSEKQELRKKIR